ncbi:FAD-dependent oxidoreductase [Mucilaginibacter lacusdianchii]|uniref:FAD-dependent oxidoreductase n=1 Tax=Mucilaginibacter lacusdianchii TaxID=2684211 RepID=UPI00131C8C7E|nr:FAD-dependent oxidoreductase [Mucilaginibacter sp. JXJ CY 39]
MENNQPNADGVKTSGTHITCWTDTVQQREFETLNQDIKADVTVIGAGIAGLTVAYCLAKAGKQVVVLEDGLVGSGETGRTTAHIANALDDRYSELAELFGEEGARHAAESHTAAIDLVEKIVTEEHIDCDFKRVDGYLFLHPSDDKKSLDEELEATHKAGLQTAMLDASDMPSIAAVDGPVLKFPQQAQFHPLKYLNGLADAFTRLGGKIYTKTHANTKTMKDGYIEANDHKVTAEYTVVATNSPINDWAAMHTKQSPYRSYVIVAKVPKDAITPALWWDTGDQDSVWPSMPYNYVRTQPFNEQYDLLIHGGADHKTGQANKEEELEEDRYQRLESWLRKHFPQAGEIVYRWSGQVMEPVDDLGFIGKNPGDEKVYIVTGDSGNGMTHGTLAGILITDLITGVENPWTKLYDPGRITLKMTSLKTFVHEQYSTLSQYVDFLLPSDVESLQQIKPGEAAIVGRPNKVAVYRDDAGAFHAYTAICPHMGCVVQWNNDEKSFDCPCHGSRFTCEGKVINGPALSDLAPVETPKQ